jgi:hypothetical protein
LLLPLVGCFRLVARHQCCGPKIVSRSVPVSGIFSKKSMNAGNIVPAEIQTRRERKSSGRSAGARSKDDWFARISSSG